MPKKYRVKLSEEQRQQLSMHWLICGSTLACVVWVSRGPFDLRDEAYDVMGQ